MKSLPLVKKAAHLVASFPTQVSPRVGEAISRIPRAKFVPKSMENLAYSDQALSIGHGQTISQPSLVAVMTDLLALKGKEKVLEIGTGSGYQAAILSQLSKKVYSIEYDSRLAATAELRLMKLGIDNVDVIVGDGSEGYPAKAPYDAIIVTAAAPNITQTLVDQLKIGGRLVIPSGSRYSQELLIVTKTVSGIKKESWGAVQFVPLLGKYGWEE